MNKCVIANWKQNMDLSAVDEWFGEFNRLVSSDGPVGAKVIIAPAYPFLQAVREYSKDGGYFVCAQDVSEYVDGPHTSFVGVNQIKDFCDFAIVGHSETSPLLEVVIKKRDNCLRVGITPIVCFPRAEDTPRYVCDGALAVWEDPQNISSDGHYNPKSLSGIHEGYKRIDSRVPVLYGGSVNRQDAGDLLNISELGGVLVGNASLDPGHFYEICKLCPKPF